MGQSLSRCVQHLFHQFLAGRSAPGSEEVGGEYVERLCTHYRVSQGVVGVTLKPK